MASAVTDEDEALSGKLAMVLHMDEPERMRAHLELLAASQAAASINNKSGQHYMESADRDWNFYLRAYGPGSGVRVPWPGDLSGARW